MSKLKLNIQRFSATNHTAHYNLSQYISTDKPTYLVDYNSDMLAIDTAIYNAMSKATVNESNIGTMENLNTTAKTDLVSALNEVNTQVGTNTTNIGTNTSNIATLGGNIGDLVNLTTTAKNNLVSAINEVKGVNDTQNTDINTLKTFENKFNFTSINQCVITATSGSIESSNVYCATNSDGSLFKLYGSFIVNASTWINTTITISNTGLPSVSEAYDIVGGALSYINQGSIRIRALHYNTNGSITITFGTGDSNVSIFYLPPCIYFNTNFGDVPTPE